MGVNAIVTGSQVYGTPKHDSDVDLVILVSADDLALLKSLGEITVPVKGSDSDPGTTGRDDGLQASIRFGKLNLIATTCPIAYAVWVKGTDYLKRQKPGSRDNAAAYFRALRIHHGLKDANPPNPHEAEPECEWEYRDAVKYRWRGEERFGLITEINHEERTVTVSYRGDDCEDVPMSKLKRAKLTDGYRRGNK